MENIWKIGIGLAGIASVGAFVFYALYREWLHLRAFATLTRDQRFKLFRWFLVSTCLFALATLVLHAYSETLAAKARKKAGSVSLQNTTVRAGNGNRGPGGDVMIRAGDGLNGVSGGDIKIGPGFYRAGDAGSNGRGGDLIIKAGDAK
jgi:hypothetical protein